MFNDLVGTTLRGKDLRFHDLSDFLLYGTDLTGARLYGAKISLQCGQFHGVKLDDTQVAMFLSLLSLADIPAPWKEGVRDLVRTQIGAHRFAALERILQIA